MLLYEFDTLRKKRFALHTIQRCTMPQPWQK